MKLSLSTFLYYNYSLIDAIWHIAAVGFDGVDIWGGRPQAYRKDLSSQEIQMIRHLLQEEGLGVASFIPAQFRYPTSLCSPNDTIRKDSITYIQDSIECAAALGAPLVSVCPGHTLFGQTKTDGLERLADSLFEIVTYASQFDLRVAIEPADAYETDLLNTCIEAQRFILRQDIPNLGVLLDNGHAQIVGEKTDEVIHELGDKLYHIHLDDNNGKRDQHLIPGDGIFDFPSLITSLISVNYKGYLGVELGWDYTIDPDPAARLAEKRLRDFISQSRTDGLE